MNLLAAFDYCQQLSEEPLGFFIIPAFVFIQSVALLVSTPESSCVELLHIVCKQHLAPCQFKFHPSSPATEIASKSAYPSAVMRATVVHVRLKHHEPLVRTVAERMTKKSAANCRSYVISRRDYQGCCWSAQV